MPLRRPDPLQRLYDSDYGRVFASRSPGAIPPSARPSTITTDSGPPMTQTPAFRTSFQIRSFRAFIACAAGSDPFASERSTRAASTAALECPRGDLLHASAARLKRNVQRADHIACHRLSNGLAFSCKPAAKSLPRFYTDIPAAGLTAATPLWTAAPSPEEASRHGHLRFASVSGQAVGYSHSSAYP